MARKKHFEPYLILWRIRLENNPAHTDWSTFDSYNSLQKRNKIFEALTKTPSPIIEFKRETNHDSYVFKPTPAYVTTNTTNRP
ncbi:MAG: hypothetical protein K9H61_02425 [Bacteroidia bacterium]|nr:hypothetical protein [Bacteroidia bacterium]MCF8427182.1 hypothetical protein [Bacteroidia bacterium]MCF8445827.1 hypothetical protein [Bacteroidia bacterium]